MEVTVSKSQVIAILSVVASLTLLPATTQLQDSRWEDRVGLRRAWRWVARRERKQSWGHRACAGRCSVGHAGILGRAGGLAPTGHMMAGSRGPGVLLSPAKPKQSRLLSALDCPTNQNPHVEKGEFISFPKRLFERNYRM